MAIANGHRCMYEYAVALGVALIVAYHYVLAPILWGISSGAGDYTTDSAREELRERLANEPERFGLSLPERVLARPGQSIRFVYALEPAASSAVEYCQVCLAKPVSNECLPLRSPRDAEPVGDASGTVLFDHPGVARIGEPPGIGVLGGSMTVQKGVLVSELTITLYACCGADPPEGCTVERSIGSQRFTLTIR